MRIGARRFVVPGLVLWMAAGQASWGARAVVEGAPAPGFRLEDRTGRRVALEELRGRPVVLHFWATWCPVCRDEMTTLEKLARDYAGRAVVLGVNLGESAKKVTTFVEARGVTFPILLDTRGKAAQAYGVTSLPATFLIKADGVVAARIPMGALTTEEIDRRLGRLAAAPP